MRPDLALPEARPVFLISSWAEAAGYRAQAGHEWLQVGEEMKAVELQGDEGVA